MQRHFLLIYATICFLLLSIILNAQPGPVSNRDVARSYRIWLQPDQGKNQSGIKWNLYQVKEDQLVLAPTFKSDQGRLMDFNKNLTVPISGIKSVKIRRMNGVGRGFLRGALLGFAVGVISGLAGGDKKVCRTRCLSTAIATIPLVVVSGSNTLYTPPETIKAETIALEKGLGFGALGGLVGMMIGGVQVKIDLTSGKQEAKQKLSRFALLKN